MRRLEHRSGADIGLAPKEIVTITLDQILSDPPLLHHDGSGAATSYRLGDEVLRFIDANVVAGSRTLETGAGLSTVLFALRGAEHVCVSPDTPVHDQIRAFCAARGISLERVTFKEGFSQDVLPDLERTPLDLVLIDGGHGFPIPFLDWAYTADRLQVDGHLIIDDINLWTGDVLKRFVSAEPEWQLVKKFGEQSVAFRKLVMGNCLKEFLFQPFVVRASTRGDWRGRFNRGIAMLARGDLVTFRERVGEYLLKRP